MAKPLRVFVSYSHKDKNYCSTLLEYLKLLEKEGLITVWHDGEILPGSEWNVEIKKRVNEAEIILLLASNAFLVSDYIERIEMEQALSRHKANISRVIPVVIKSCAWQASPIGKIQALPVDDDGKIKPVTNWDDENEAYFNVQEGIRKAIIFLGSQNQPQPGNNNKPRQPIEPPPPTTYEDEYYKLYGLRGLRVSSLIQNFDVKRTAGAHNINAVQFYWADSLFANTISAENIKDGKTLRVRFDHKGGWGCNIAIRCQDGMACHNKNRSRYLIFDARIPLEEIQDSIKSETLNEVGISVRIVNGRMQHWEYAFNPREYIICSVRKNEWGGEPVKIDLSDNLLWHQFTSDGNIKLDPDGPDFSVIAAVILKFGKVPQFPTEPEPGRGIIDIRALQLIDI
ncbi:toll/interleukin-1 receptor domain-containing protein [Desulfobacterium sp. N47]|uniref:TIR domain-containing protein n=1 Tax=uncultured Desulfobacterium sp. TaxID=201089 RepID=E1YM08_9BACT|nr:hypothetical protein N47_E46530 [uncultured Desulfobacterium sp.]